MKRIVVAGYGNPLRGDDGVGWRIAEAIAQRWGNRIRVLMGQQPMPEWVPELATADVAFIVDAARGADGGLRVRRLYAAENEQLLDSHTLGPEQLLGLADTLYGHVPETFLLLLPAENLQFGEALSPATTRAAERVLRFLDRRITAWNWRAAGGGG